MAKVLLALAVAAALPAAAQQAQTAILLEVSRFEIVGDNPLSEADTAETLRPHLGTHRDLATLEKAATALEGRMRDDGFAFHRVIVPAQKPAGGIVQLQVLRFPLGAVEVRGNKHFTRENILASLPGLKPGASPDVREMARELALANEHPTKRVSVVMKEGRDSDAIDAEVRVRDVPPVQTVVVLTGQTRDQYDEINRNTGYTRLTVAHQRSNLFDLDHSLTLIYTTSPDEVRKVNQLGVFYGIPLYGYHGSLQFYYTRSDVSTGSIGAGLSGADFNVSGRGEFFGARGNYILPKWGDVNQTVSLAIDDKHFANTASVAIVGLSLTLPQDIHARPLSFRYQLRGEKPWGSGEAHIEYAANLHGGGSNAQAAYTAVRAGAALNWDAFRYGFDLSTHWANWALSARMRGQFTDSLLIPGEQFGLGGAGSVRGLRDREVTGDRGHSLTLEALGPALVDTLQPVLFYDQGRVVLKNSTGILQRGSESASSVGAGLRWSWRKQLDVSADLAYVLNGVADIGTVPGTQAGRSKISFNVLYRF